MRCSTFIIPLASSSWAITQALTEEKAANNLQILTADVKRIHPGHLVRRHNTVKDNLPSRANKLKSPFNNRDRPVVSKITSNPLGANRRSFVPGVIGHYCAIDVHSHCHLEAAFCSSGDHHGCGP